MLCTSMPSFDQVSAPTTLKHDRTRGCGMQHMRQGGGQPVRSRPGAQRVLAQAMALRTQAHQVAGVESKVQPCSIKIGLAVGRELVCLRRRVACGQRQARGLRVHGGAAQVDGRLLRRIAVGRRRAAGPCGRPVGAVAPVSDKRAMTWVSTAPGRSLRAGAALRAQRKAGPVVVPGPSYRSAGRHR